MIVSECISNVIISEFSDKLNIISELADKVHTHTHTHTHTHYTHTHIHTSCIPIHTCIHT